MATLDVAIGDALLRLAEKAVVKQMNDEFAWHLVAGDATQSTSNVRNMKARGFAGHAGKIPSLIPVLLLTSILWLLSNQVDQNHLLCNRR